MQTIADKKQFDEFINSRSKFTKIVHFWADWSAASVQLDEFLLELQNEYGKNFDAAKLDAEAVSDISLQFDVKAVPTVVAFQNGKQVTKIEGFHPVKLRELVVKSEFEENAQKNGENAVGQEEQMPTESLNERLKRLINRARLTLFMKGSPEAPKCGFSRQIVDLLNQNGVAFWSFDILSDEQVRQGLKEYSDWPTYPQLYMDGELLGGLDVIREEMKDPEFVAKLPKN